jgi:hypothetical protein
LSDRGGIISGEPRREVDDWDKSPSFLVGAPARRSASSLGITMNHRRYGATSVTGCLALWGSSVVIAGQPRLGIDNPRVPDTDEAACTILKKVVVKQRHLPPNTPTEYQWYCDVTTTKNEYMRIIGLRAGKCDAASCLMGWFAVMRRSAVVLQYDVGNDRVVPLDSY